MDAMDYSILHAKSPGSVSEPTFSAPSVMDDVGRVYWTIRTIGRATHEEAVRAAKPILLAWARDRKAHKESFEEKLIDEVDDKSNAVADIDTKGAAAGDFFNALESAANALKEKHRAQGRLAPSIDDLLSSLGIEPEEPDEDEAASESRY